MLNKKLYALLFILAAVSFAQISFAADTPNEHPDSSQLFANNDGNPPDLTDQVDCCYRQRTKSAYTQKTCPPGSYVVYAAAKTRIGRAPAIYYQCETVQVFCRYETAKQCTADRNAA